MRNVCDKSQLEVIVVDDCSIDGTLMLIKMFLPMVLCAAMRMLMLSKRRVLSLLPK